jgi:hypothetical protein
METMEALIVLAGLLLLCAAAPFFAIDSRPPAEDRRPWWPSHRR